LPSIQLDEQMSVTGLPVDFGNLRINLIMQSQKILTPPKGTTPNAEAHYVQR